MAKQKKEHNLSARSKLVNKDFGKGNNISSAIYTIFKDLLPIRDRKNYIRLSNAMTHVLHSGPVEELGSRQLRHGDLGYLVGYRLNPYTLVSSIFLRTGVIRYDFADEGIKVGVPEIYRKDLCLPKTATALLAIFCCVEIDEDGSKIQSHTSPPLTIPVFESAEPLITAKKFRIPLSNPEGKIILVVFALKTKLADRAGESFLSLDRKYFAGEIMAVGHVQDGEWMTFKKSKRMALTCQHPEQDVVEGTWEDDESC